MLRFLIPIVLLGLGAGAGVLAARIFATEPAATAAAPDSRPDTEAHAGAPPAEGQGAEAAETDSDVEYVRLNNQFIVPIVRHGMVRSLVVIALSIEVPPDAAEAVYAREPRLRDDFLQVMFAHANMGGFDGSFTRAAALAPLRDALREAARGILGDLARDVLIVDIVRQDA